MFLVEEIKMQKFHFMLSFKFQNNQIINRDTFVKMIELKNSFRSSKLSVLGGAYTFMDVRAIL